MKEVLIGIGISLVIFVVYFFTAVKPINRMRKNIREIKNKI